MPQRLRDLLAGLAALLMGAAAFFAFCGWWPLLVTNIAWLEGGDRAMHQLGWMFFRDSPWGLPPGASPRLGIELAASIALVDGLPLLAMPFKLVAPWLPQPFQYWGWWLLVSFMLQGLFAYRIARELDAGRLVALLAAGFALITPAYLFRIPLHLALSSHWVVLAALLLYMRRAPPRPAMWPLLLALTAAIHATLLAMVAALWCAALLQRLWTDRTEFRALLVEMFAALAATLATLWLVGFFGAGTYAASGYGSYKLNLLWPILSYHWSQLFPDLPHGRLDYEGLAFPGIGILALLLIAVLTGAVLRLRAAVSPFWLPLALVLVALMIFAFSKTLTLGDADLVTLPVPGFVDALGAAFRSTGRFVWPLLYVITIGAVVLAGARFRPALAVPLVLALLVAQGIDSWPEARRFRAFMPQPSPVWETSFTSPLWERAAESGYTRLRAIPEQVGFGSDWKDPGYFAVTHGLDTDIAYLARIDPERLQMLRTRAEHVLATGAFEPRTIYLLDVYSALRAVAHLGPDDLLVTVDGRNVLLPGGRALAAGLNLTPLAPAD